MRNARASPALAGWSDASEGSRRGAGANAAYDRRNCGGLSRDHAIHFGDDLAQVEGLGENLGLFGRLR